MVRAPSGCSPKWWRLDEAGARLLPFERLDGIGIGARVRLAPDQAGIRPTEAWLGRVLDAFGRPLDGGQALPPGPSPYRLKAPRSKPIAGAIWGRRWISACALSTCSRPAARASASASSPAPASASRPCLPCWRATARFDALVVGLIGERRRELAAFVNDQPGPAGLARAVVVVATSDLPAVVRRRAA